MSWLLVGAIVLPLACGVAGLLLRPRRAVQQWLSLAAGIGHLGIATTLLVNVWSRGSRWPKSVGGRLRSESRWSLTISAPPWC